MEGKRKVYGNIQLAKRLLKGYIGQQTNQKIPRAPALQKLTALKTGAIVCLQQEAVRDLNLIVQANTPGVMAGPALGIWRTRRIRSSNSSSDSSGLDDHPWLHESLPQIKWIRPVVLRKISNSRKSWSKRCHFLVV